MENELRELQDQISEQANKSTKKRGTTTKKNQNARG